jgi:hypothetical protein
VPDRGDALEIERYVEVCQRVDAGGHVDERLRPATSGTHTAVLEVPGRPPARREIEAELRHQRPPEARAPVPAVHDDGDGVGSCPVGHEELRDLARVATERMVRPGAARGVGHATTLLRGGSRTASPAGSPSVSVSDPSVSPLEPTLQRRFLNSTTTRKAPLRHPAQFAQEVGDLLDVLQVESPNDA